MLNCFLKGIDGSRDFCNYARIGHPDVMGFPSAFSDTEWMFRRKCGDPVSYITGVIEERAEAGRHMPLMLHDWVAWNHAADKDLTHVRIFAERARDCGFDLMTHAACVDVPGLWTGQVG
jgi:hypothetical protein